MEAQTITTVLQGLDFKPIVDVILTAVVVSIPTIVAVLGIKKGISWTLGMVRGA